MHNLHNLHKLSLFQQAMYLDSSIALVPSEELYRMIIYLCATYRYNTAP